MQTCTKCKKDREVLNNDFNSPDRYRAWYINEQWIELCDECMDICRPILVKVTHEAVMKFVEK